MILWFSGSSKVGQAHSGWVCCPCPGCAKRNQKAPSMNTKVWWWQWWLISRWKLTQHVVSLIHQVESPGIIFKHSIMCLWQILFRVLWTLGTPSRAKSSVFFNIVQTRGGGIKPMFKKSCCTFCILLGAIWRYNLQHKCSKTREGGGVKGRLNNVQKNRRFGTGGRP